MVTDQEEAESVAYVNKVLAQQAYQKGLDGDLLILWRIERLKRGIAALTISIAVVIVKATIFYGGGYTARSRRLLTRIYDDWNILSFIGLITIVYFCIAVIAMVIRQRR